MYGVLCRRLHIGKKKRYKESALVHNGPCQGKCPYLRQKQTSALCSFQTKPCKKQTKMQTVHKNVFFFQCLFSHWNFNQVDLVHYSWAKQQPNLAIFRNTLNLFHGELTREKHISSYQSNRKWRVSSSTPNQDRSCSEMCLGIVPISLFPSRFFSCSLGQAGRN